MKLEDFLKCKKVKCVKAHYNSLTVGKEYSVLNIRIGVEVIDDAGSKYYWRANHFEPVPNSAETPPQVAKPRFSVGEKVYFGTAPDIKIVSDVNNDNTVRFFGEFDWADSNHCCPATQENYEKLCSLFECIDFEQPPKPLAGSDLTRAMLDKGWEYVLCYISDSSDTHALERQTRTIAVITGTHKDHPSFFVYGSGKSFIPHAVPFDPRTSEPLTEAVLDE